MKDKNLNNYVKNWIWEIQDMVKLYNSYMYELQVFQK